jgi:hypothetical protein
LKNTTIYIWHIEFGCEKKGSCAIDIEYAMIELPEGVSGESEGTIQILRFISSSVCF